MTKVDAILRLTRPRGRPEARIICLIAGILHDAVREGSLFGMPVDFLLPQQAKLEVGAYAFLVRPRKKHLMSTGDPDTWWSSAVAFPAKVVLLGKKL